MTSVPGISFTDVGFVAPAQSLVLAGVLEDYNAAFGGNLNPDLTTPQGQLCTTTAAIVSSNYDEQCALYNGVDPAFASGRLQDAIGRIYFLTRNPAQATVVQALCTGAVGVSIPTGSLAVATDGNIYTCTSGGVIGAGGTVTLTFTCQVTGPIVCPAGQLNTVYQAIPGWDSITNPTDGVEGNDVESRSAFEARRAASVALNARGTVQAVQANVLDVAGVLDAYTIQNNTSAPVTTGGFTLVANSIYCAVVGGNAADIADAIWRKTSPGCNYNGNTTVTVYDDNSGYSMPYPSYAVKFEIPADLTIKFAVVMANNVNVPANATALIQAAILNAFAGGDGGPRARIGSEIFASRFYSTVALLGSWAQVVSILIGTVTPTLTTVQVGIAQVPVSDAGSIAVSFV